MMKQLQDYERKVLLLLHEWDTKSFNYYLVAKKELYRVKPFLVDEQNNDDKDDDKESYTDSDNDYDKLFNVITSITTWHTQHQLHVIIEM